MLESNDQLVDELVGNEDYLYIISNYQRFYVWDEGKVDTYLNDILLTISRRESDPTVMHYFGQFIVLEVDKDRRRRKTYEVIDGQQRLTTFLMLVAGLYGKAAQLAKSAPEAEEAAQVLQKKCLGYLESNKQGAPKETKLRLSEIDNTYYTAIINSLRNNTEVTKHASPESHKRLYYAQLRIRERIAQIVAKEKTTADKVVSLQRILDTATDAFQVVVLEPTEERYTYQLYQVVNDRGEPLKDGELLKAKSIEVLASNEDYVTKARTIWDDILKDPGKKTDEYLKWCYMSKLGAEKSQDRYYRAFLEDYFRCPEDITISAEIQSQFLKDLEGLQQDITVCRKLDQGIWPYEEEDSSITNWQKAVLDTLIVGRKHKLCIPVLLSAYVQFSGKKTKDAEKNFYSCLEICETFFVLVKGVFAWREDRLKERYLQAAKEMRNPEAKFQSQQLKALLAEIDPKMVREECLQKLKNLSYAAKGENGLMKHLCVLLETYWRCFDADGKVYTNRVPDGTNLVYKELSLEHIYPESAPDEQKDEALAANKHRLGNLLIYGKKDNSKLKNKSYTAKKELYRTARFSTASFLVDTVDNWTLEEYNKRHNDVCKKLETLLLRFYPDEKATQKKAAKHSQNPAISQTASIL